MARVLFVISIIVNSILAGMVLRLWIVRVRQRFLGGIKTVLPPLASLVWFGFIVNDVVGDFNRVTMHRGFSFHTPIRILLGLVGIFALRQVLQFRPYEKEGAPK